MINSDCFALDFSEMGSVQGLGKCVIDTHSNEAFFLDLIEYQRPIRRS